jgi:hypothetical protein
MVGILVHGDNHLILRGPLPEREVALALVRRWCLVQIGVQPQLHKWQAVTREFRENLKWAVVVPGETEASPAVTKLLADLSIRGITIHRYSFVAAAARHCPEVDLAQTFGTIRYANPKTLSTSAILDGFRPGGPVL